MTFPQRFSARILENRMPAPGIHELSFARNDLAFRAGEEITVHGPPDLGDRTYSLLSGEKDRVLQILFRVVPEGAMSPWLARLAPDDTLDFTGPHGNFILRDRARSAVFVATGTGVAPAVSFMRTHPGLDLALVHGVRAQTDLCYGHLFQERCYVPCVSRGQAEGVFHGRVTDWFTANPPGKADVDYYLCGSNDMITEMRTLLLAQGCSEARIFAEPYYFW